MTRNSHVPGTRTALLSAATAHAERGWHVFPLRPGSKQPALHGEDHCRRTGSCRDTHQGWEQQATTDQRQIQRWWPGSSMNNIGIACGPSGLVVLDLDTPKDPRHTRYTKRAIAATHDGASMLAGLCQRHGESWPFATFTVATPNGRHLYFTVCAAERLRNTAGRLGWCIDTRAAGGYVVAPGSIINGHVYVVVNDAAPQPLPEWLATQLTQHAAPLNTCPPSLPPTHTVAHTKRYARAALTAEIQRVLDARHGQRNHTLNRAAFALGQLAAADMLPTTLIYAELTSAARRVGLDRDPNCGPRGIDATIRSGLAAGSRKPRTA